MKEKNVYFIFTIEENDKLYSIEIESINIQELSNTTLHQEISLSTNKNTFFALKLKLIFDGKTFFSQEFQIPNKNNSKFNTFSFNKNGNYFVDYPPQSLDIPFYRKYFIFKDHIEFSPNLLTDFINDSFIELKQNKNFNFLCFLDLLKDCYNSSKIIDFIIFFMIMIILKIIRILAIMNI